MKEEVRKTCFLCGVDSTQEWHTFTFDGHDVLDECHHCHTQIEESGEKEIEEIEDRWTSQSFKGYGGGRRAGTPEVWEMSGPTGEVFSRKQIRRYE